jgi:AcrR family transcriptional regulator
LAGLLHMGKLAQNKAENRSKILDAAYKVFADKGFEHATVADIVAEAGVARGTFYNYFQSVEDVWTFLAVDMQKEASQIAHQARVKATSGYALIYDAYRLIFGQFEARPDALKLMARNQSAARNSLLTGPGVDSIVRLLEADLRNSGFFDHFSDRQLAIASFSMVGSAFEILVQHHDRGWPIQADQMAGEMAKLFFIGMERMDDPKQSG